MLTAALLSVTLTAAFAAELPEPSPSLTAVADPTTAPSIAPSVTLATAPVYVAAASSGAPRMKRPLLAGGLNFFLPGTGYLYNGEKPLYVSLPILAGVVGLTYIEQIHQFEGGTLSEQDPMAFRVMFGAVLVMNTGMAIDAYREARMINSRNATASGQERGVSVALSPAAFPGEEATSYGLTLNARF